VSLSVFGCVLDEVCACSRSFPIALLAAQMALLISALLVGSTLFPKIAASARASHATPLVRRFLSKGPLLSEVSPPLQHVEPVLRPAARAVADLATTADGGIGAFTPIAAVFTTMPTVVAQQSRANLVPARGAPVLHGWKAAGDGYCEDCDSHQEFSSLHTDGKTLQECAEAGTQDPNSIAFDFTESNGGCDIRYASGVLAVPIKGYVWWGWGAGMGNPSGFGKKKHDLETKCYARVVHATPAPAPATLAPTHIPSAAEVGTLIEQGHGRFSVVLACAAEGAFMVKTVKSFCDRTPEHVLHEIIVVDDGTDPPLEGLLTQIEPRCKLKVLRHNEVFGLMIAKQTGGDAATGEFIGFFDCHVCPNNIWYKELMHVLQGGPRRMAVPTITDLDIDIWDERASSQVNSKCYIDFNAQFMWFEDESDYIPVISGGLVALTRSWWKESGGFDSRMRGWGGENVDQSLRTWLCGGEIIRAKSSRIAHMWRVPSDSRTSAHYKHVTFGVDNIARVAAAWFDKFKSKYRDGYLEGPTPPDVSNIVAIQKKLQCKPYTYFLHRFRKVYVNGALLPSSVFKLRSQTGDRCIARRGEMYEASPCREASWFHLANQNPKNSSKCCSGIRQWNAMECFDRLDAQGVFPYYCDVTGKNDNQHYFLTQENTIRHPYSSSCVSLAAGGNRLVSEPCESATKWDRAESFVPLETSEYRSEVISLGLDESSPDN